MSPRPSTSPEASSGASPAGRARRGRASLFRSAVPGQRQSHRGRKLYQRRSFWAAVTLAVLGGSAVVVNTASAGTVDTDNWYVLVNRSSGKVLDAPGYATNDGASLTQWSRNGGTNQQWKFIDSGDGNYRLQNRRSGKVLDDYHWSKTEGSELVQWRDLNATNQQFHMEKSSDGYVRLINRFSGLAVEVEGASKADGGRVAQYHDWNGAQQQWQLVPADSVSGTGTTGSSGSSAPATPAPAAAPATGSSSSTKRFMGSDTVLVGGMMNDTSGNAAPFDMRYAYVHSQPAPSSDYYTASRCKSEWSSWWGCWSGETTAPGFYVTWNDDHVNKVTYQGKPRPQKNFWTWYSLRDLGDLAGEGDGPGEVKAINRTDLLTRYLNDYRFFLQKIGNSQDAIDIEPDFWGYVRSLGNPHQVAAQVKAANPTDCGSQENSAVGLAQCMISMAHKYAPNTGAGFHLTCWDWESNMQKCVSDYSDLGAKNADFLVADVVDRDAGWYAKPENGGRDTFWNDQKAKAALGWYKTMAESVGKPVVLWQIPLGNMSQNNTFGHYKDDKVDWFFSHMDQVANAHVAALLFGPGQQEQTTIESDGGNLVNKTTAYRNSGGQPLK
ncbi:RICIN domain-containing protein [Streptomyces graminilatus]|uniref:RICIN domain-containing protein n=1 Tax=Streptomyces graminilatus TaxID=1464070 RepID=UPI00099E1FB8|nr:RICIN domain-containing protein [Streptomyces graminilatus]